LLIVGVGMGSTDIVGTGSNQWAKGNSAYSTMQTAVSGSGLATFKAVLALFGPNAIVNGTTPTQASVLSALQTLATNLASDIAGAPALFVDVFGQVTTGSPPDRRGAENNFRQAVLQGVGLGSFKLGPVLIDQSYGDGVHPDTSGHSGENVVIGRRFWVAYKNALLSGTDGRGPRIASAVIDVTKTIVTVTYDRALGNTDGSSVAGFIVKDGGSAGTISSEVVAGGTRVVFRMSSAIAGVATLDFASNDDAAGATVPKSAAITLPSSATVALPAEPVLAQSINSEGGAGPAFRIVPRAARRRVF
jgi:hypothetical protein